MEMERKKTFWLSFDLGIRGDYAALYRWLDERQAKECGDNVAAFQFACSTANPSVEVKASLDQSVQFKQTDRVYLIWMDETRNMPVGTFIVGHRKTAPWEGFFVTEMEPNLDL